MFDGIVLTHTVAEKPLVSRAIAPQEVIKPVYDRENLMNSEFHITGSADSFVRPPLSERAQSRLSYLQALPFFRMGQVHSHGGRIIVHSCCCIPIRVRGGWSTKGKHIPYRRSGVP